MIRHLEECELFQLLFKAWNFTQQEIDVKKVRSAHPKEIKKGRISLIVPWLVRIPVNQDNRG